MPVARPIRCRATGSVTDLGKLVQPGCRLSNGTDPGEEGSPPISVHHSATASAELVAGQRGPGGVGRSSRCPRHPDQLEHGHDVQRE